MLFNSYSFLLLFLPITLVVFFVLAKRGEQLAASWLAAASLVFYGCWDYHYIPLLLGSICFNYWCGLRIRDAAPATRRPWLIFSVTADLVLLGYYKYAGFFVSSVNSLGGEILPVPNIILPIGISFFTFTQIAFLVDTYQKKVNESRFVHYLLFVTYFPHLIAGPVLHHKEMMPQFADRKNYIFSTSNFAVGLSIFCIGLAKKVLLADNLAPYANPLFSQPDHPSVLVAWGGVLAYTFQLYFDFSGYSDMAIGLSRLFGVKLPLNFDSPYKSTNISEFWRRWHMTLSRFLRDYLYIALGGNRKGPARRYANLIITMVLGGLWHGAGWTFVIWGALHGVYLVIQHGWSALAKQLNFPLTSKVWKVISVAITFVAVCFAWVFFRAPDLPTSWEIIQGMAGYNGVGLPDAIGNRLGGLKTTLEQAGIIFYLGGGARFIETWSWVVVAGVVAFFMPNTQQIMGKFEPALDFQLSSLQTKSYRATVFQWAPGRLWAVVLAILALASALSLNRPSEFLYFQF